MAYRVLVVDDFMMSRAVFENAVAQSPQYELAASLDTAEKAVAYCRERPVDLIIMDVVMTSGMDGLAASGEIKRSCPKVKILLVTSMPEVSYIARAREIGIDSFWYKEIQEQPLLEIMDRTMAGESVYPNATPPVTLGNIVSTELTARELEVLRELVGGASNREIAERLFLSEETVKMHLKNMLQKTGFRSRLELAIKARTGGLVINDRYE